MLAPALAERLRAFDPVATELGGHRHAAVAVAIFTRAGVEHVWLTRRSSALRRHAGQFALPGGRVDAGESAWQAALRELAEELGVPLGEDAYLARLDDYTTRSGYVITPFVVDAGEDPVTSPSDDEVAELHEVSFAELAAPARFPHIPESDRPVIQLPLVGALVHAPTAAILYQFRELVLHGRTVRVAHLEQPVFAWR